MSKKRIITFKSFPGPDEVFEPGRTYSLFRGTKGSTTTYTFKLNSIRYEVDDSFTKMSMLFYPDGKVGVSKKNVDSKKLVDNIGYFVLETDIVDYAQEYGIQVTMEFISNIMKSVLGSMRDREKELIETNRLLSDQVNELTKKVNLNEN